MSLNRISELSEGGAAHAIEKVLFRSDAIERRKHRRRRIAALVFLCWTGATGRLLTANGMIRDLSCHGAFLEADVCPFVGAFVQMSIVGDGLAPGSVEMPLTGEGAVLRIKQFTMDGNGRSGRGFALSMRFRPELTEELLSRY